MSYPTDPMRKVVRVVQLRGSTRTHPVFGYSYRTAGSLRMLLECGHWEERPGAKKAPKRARCAQCGKAADKITNAPIFERGGDGE